MVLNAAVQMLREADELKQKILKFKSGTSMLQERSLWATQQQLQKVYQKVLVLDLDYALDKKVEQDLWNVGFKQQIEALQAISKDRKNPLRSEGQAMLSWVLQAAAGFYLCLLHQICTAFKLDLPFRRRASLLGWVEGWGAGTGAPDAAATGRGAPAAARYICQHCLVHLGDLARYRQQLRVAHTFYRHALVVSAHSGQPYNQLALVWWRRGRRLGALYWHVRSLLVRAPFPPAPSNLRRTLRAAAAAAAATTGASGRELQVLPVLPGITPAPATAGPGPAPARLDAHSYVSDLIRALHLIHTVEELETATSLVESLNSALAALVATDSFESMTLIKMAVVIMWLVQSSTEGGEAALAQSEAAAAALAHALACGAVLALLLPAYALSAPPARALPALKVWLQWLTCAPGSCAGAAWVARPQLWPALAHNLNLLADDAARVSDKYDTIPLPEDEELLGFLPLEPALSTLRFPSHAALDRKPEQNDVDENECGGEVSPACLSNEPALEARVRARRLTQLGRMLADQNPDQLSYTEEDNKLTFTAAPIGDTQLSQLVRALHSAHASAGGGGGGGGDDEGDSDDDRAATAPPTVISEADFREKVREKRVGILKPQGSLERAREERAMANTQDDEGDTSEDLKGEDKKEARKPRVNIAMAAIMRKQEETNKQVKFVTPPPTPDSIPETDVKDAEKPKMIQPKPIKSLANLPIGRKTGGILSLKDKSAGYPHLVNTDPEPKKEEEKKKEVKPNQSSQNSQQYPKRPDQPSPNWPANTSQAYEGPRMNFPKTYGIQSPGLSYSPGMNYPQPTMNNQGIRLPVVNPKEIDVRTAALQKQNSRQELFQDGHKFGNYKYQVSGDKKNFLNDLPPRFANQYRYWQTAQDNQFNDNKFRDENFQSNNSLFNTQQRPNWMNTTPLPETYQQPNPWWTPEKPPPNFNANFTTPMNIQPNYYSPHLGTNMASPYPNMSFNQMPNQIGQDKPQNLITPPNYLQTAIGQPQMPTLQNLVSSPNFNSSLNNFGSYAPPVGYDSSMYPQFNNKLGYQPLQMKMMDKPQTYQNKDMMDMGGLGFGGNVMDMQQRNLMTFNDPMAGGNDVGGAKNLEQVGPGVAGSPPGGEAAAGAAAAAAGNTYSLFSGAADTSAWAAAAAPRLQHQPQSLWSGPGPSPLERLLEQQKQMKPAPAPH